MRIQHNQSALFVWRQWGQQQGHISTAIQRLSSGLRINSAADDPSGMTISQRMKMQLSMLKSEQQNVEAGMSTLDILEAPLIETQKMLHRLAELAQKAAGGLNSDSDLEALDAEYQQLLQEIGRSQKSTPSPMVSLFRSQQQGKTSTDPTTDPNAISIRGGNLNAYLDGLDAYLKDINLAAQKGDSAKLDGLGLSIASGADNREGLQQAVMAFTREKGEQLLQSPAQDGQAANDGYVIWISGGNITIKAGPSQGSADCYGLAGTNLLTQKGAATAQDAVREAMKTVSSKRSDLGATRNRLEHTINLMATMEVNLSASLSRIQDADMAKEMMTLAREQILSQANAFLMAQTQRTPEQVLKLLWSL